MKRQFGEQGKARIHILSGPISEKKDSCLSWKLCSLKSFTNFLRELSHSNSLLPHGRKKHGLCFCLTRSAIPTLCDPMDTRSVDCASA